MAAVCPIVADSYANLIHTHTLKYLIKIHTRTLHRHKGHHNKHQVQEVDDNHGIHALFNQTILMTIYGKT